MRLRWLVEPNSPRWLAAELVWATRVILSNFPTVAEFWMLAKVSGGRISDRCGNFVEGVRCHGRLLQHVTRRPPRRAPCLARLYQVTMRASFQRVGPGKPGSQLPRLGWVIAAWVLECRARSADSSVRTACDSYC